MNTTLRFSFLAPATVLLFCVSSDAQAQQVPQALNMSFFVTSLDFHGTKMALHDVS